MVHKKQKWSPSLMCKRPDNLVSSEYSNLKTQFEPSYEKEEVNMWSLMAMDYQRMWFEEKECIKKVVLAAQDNDFLVRRYVKRGLLLRRKEEEKKKPFKMKRFEAVPSKIKIRSKEEIDKMMSKLSPEEKDELMKEAKEGRKKPKPTSKECKEVETKTDRKEEKEDEALKSDSEAGKPPSQGEKSLSATPRVKPPEGTPRAKSVVKKSEQKNLTDSKECQCQGKYGEKTCNCKEKPHALENL